MSALADAVIYLAGLAVVVAGTSVFMSDDALSSSFPWRVLLGVALAASGFWLMAQRRRVVPPQ